MKPKKRILVFIDWYIPGYKAGGPIRSCANLIAHLEDEFEFLVVTRDTDYTESTPYPGITSDAWNVLPDGTRVYYISAGKLHWKVIRRIISETEYDAIYLNGIYSVYFTLIPLLLLRKRSGKRIVLAVRGMLAESAIRVKQTKKKLFLRISNQLGLFRNLVFHASTPEEEADIRREFGPSVKVLVAGNLPAKKFPEIPYRRVKMSGTLRLVSVARIAPEKNLLYALQILKGFHGARVEFDIYGPIYDQAYWESCQALISSLPQNIKVRLCGSIENDKVTKLLAGYHILFMPTRGENFGHIILQAMSSGCLPLISDRTPWKGLRMKGAGWDIPLNDENGFREALQEASRMAQDEFDRMSDSCYQLASGYVHDKRILEMNKILFR